MAANVSGEGLHEPCQMPCCRHDGQSASAFHDTSTIYAWIFHLQPQVQPDSLLYNPHSHTSSPTLSWEWGEVKVWCSLLCLWLCVVPLMFVEEQVDTVSIIFIFDRCEMSVPHLKACLDCNYLYSRSFRNTSWSSSPSFIVYLASHLSQQREPCAQIVYPWSEY